MSTSMRAGADIIRHTTRLRETIPQAASAMDGARAKQVVGTVIDHFQRNLGDPLTLEALAEETGCSTFGIIRAFRRLTGVTPMRFLSLLRLAEAKRMLLTDDISVIHICYEVGYESLGSFNNRFKALVGFTPTGLRKVLRTLDLGELTASAGSLRGDDGYLHATAIYKNGGAYAHLLDLRMSVGDEEPMPGCVAVRFAIPWAKERSQMLLQGDILRSEPIPLDGRARHGSMLRPSTRYDPPVLPVIATCRVTESARPRAVLTH